MGKSIVLLLLLAAIGSLVASVLSNLMRISEIRELKRELQRYEEAFRSVKMVTKYIKEENERPKPEAKIKVVDREDLPKFGDE